MASLCMELGDPSDMAGVLSIARDVLLQSGVIAAPTETVYGLMTLWRNVAGRDMIYELKARPREKRLQMLAYDIPQAGMCGVVQTPVLDALAEAFWPGPLTAVVDTDDGGTIGLRIPDHPFVLALLQGLPEPLAATSANRSNTPAAVDIEAALNGLEGDVDLAVDGGVIPVGEGLASTVVSLSHGELTLLREGPIPFAAVLEEARRIT